MIAVNPDRTCCPYEVGDILQTINSTPPAQRWPGTQWQQITDRFVRGADAQHPAETTGGSWTHAQTVDEMAAHVHLWNTGYVSGEGITWPAWSWYAGNSAQNPAESNAAGAATTQSGGGQPMDITNPYFSAYIWLRTG